MVKMRNWVMATIVVCVIGATALGAMALMRSINPAQEWSGMVQTLVSHARRLRVHGHFKLNNTFVEGTATIDKGHPKFQAILNFISKSSFIRKWDVIPPYPISHILTFYLNNEQQLTLDYESDYNYLWWKGVYQANVNPKLEETLNEILTS